jgi:hypothetical protein
MAAVPGCHDRTPTVVHYRNRCVENEHPRRRCPLPATVANVMSIADVLAIMTEYWATGLRSTHYAWDDVSSDWIDADLRENGRGIKVIRPKRSKGGAA